MVPLTRVSMGDLKTRHLKLAMHPVQSQREQALFLALCFVMSTKELDASSGWGRGEPQIASLPPTLSHK